MSAITKKNIQESIPIPNDLSDVQRRELAARMLIEVRSRTKRGLDKNGNTFKGYSKNYDKTGTPDLSQTGDMLALIDVISIGNSSITIGYEKDDPVAGQVNGNVTGEYGNKSPVAPKRDFIGLPKTVVKLLVAEVRAETEENIAPETDSRSSLISNILGRLSNRNNVGR